MKKMRLLALVLSLCLILSVFAACGEAPETTTGEAASKEETTKEQTTVTEEAKTEAKETEG